MHHTRPEEPTTARTATKRKRAAVDVPPVTARLLPLARGTHFPAAAHDAKAAAQVFSKREEGVGPKESAYEAARGRAPGGAFGGPLPIISWQKNVEGTRKYTVTSWPAFWETYRRCPPPARRYYELVRTDCPCKLFFDIEDEFAAGDTGALAALEARVAQLAQWVSARLEEDLGGADVEVQDVAWLDASAVDRGKFSVHLVWNLANARAPEYEAVLFKTPDDVQTLVEWLHTRALADHVACWWKGSVDAAEKPVEQRVRADGLVDFAVHTHGDREMRLMYSTKAVRSPAQAQQQRFLYPRALDLETGHVAAAVPRLDRDTFFDSLVTYVPETVRLGAVLAVDFAKSVRVSAQGRLLGLPGETDTLRRTGRGGGGGGAGRSLAHLSPETVQLLGVVKLGMEAVCPDAATLRFERYYDRDDRWCAVFRSTNRYCELQGREHRSNGVYYVCWLATGRFYQRCLDPDCADEYRTDLAAEVAERQRAYEAEKARWTVDEREAEEEYLQGRREMAHSPELRARGEVYTLQPEVAIPGTPERFPLWAALSAFGRLRSEQQRPREDESETPPPSPKKPRLFLGDPEEDAGDVVVKKECTLDTALDIDQADGFEALFA